MRQLTIILLLLFLISEVKSQADSIYYLDSGQIAEIHSNIIPIIFYNHLDNTSIIVRSSRSGPTFEYSFYKFSFNKFTNEISLIGTVVDAQDKTPIFKLKIYLGKLNKDAVEIKKEIGIVKYSTFYVDEFVSKEDYIFFYRYDHITEDDILLAPMEHFNLSLLWKYTE